jgi:hypothetical protein
MTGLYRQSIAALILWLVTGLLTMSALAQSVEPSLFQQNETVDNQTQEDDQESDAGNEQANMDDEQSQEERPDIDNQPIENGADNRPGRFIPSEQISLDLGVSFPVDV